MLGAWSGDDWQDYCNRLFTARHAPAGYQRVPDKDQGDLGIEGFSLDGTGCAYQCYASQAIDSKKLYESQRDKITTDLGKLVRRAKRVADLVGVHIIHRWILVVPVHTSKELVIHARRKEIEMRDEGLAFIADDFVIAIQTEADFAAEKSILEDAGAAMVSELPEFVDPAALESFALDEAEQVQRMDEKLAKVVKDPPTAKEQRDRFLRQAVDGGNIQEHLRKNHPETAEQITRQIAIEERSIVLERVGDVHQGALDTVQRRLEERLNQKVAAVGDDQASRLSHASVARWLMECPLDFPDPDE